VLGKNCTILANLLDKHKDTVPLAGLIEAMHIGKSELISFKIHSLLGSIKKDAS
jgi:hypothetical protein